MSATRLRWGLILLGGFLVEVVLIAIAIPLNAWSETVTYYSAPVLVVVSAFFAARWVAGRAGGRFVLHGALVAVVASAIYIALTTAMGAAGEIPLLFHFLHAARIAAGAAGGAAAQRQVRPRPVSAI